MISWKLVKEVEVIKVGWRTLTRKTFEQPDGGIQVYETIGEPDAKHAAVIALTPDNQVVVAEQFRPGPEMTMWELPGGNIEEGEDHQAAVMRELHEEVGYASNDVTFLGTNRKDAYLNATWYYYLARNCQPLHEQSLDDTEFINVRLISVDELIANAKSGKMSDGLAVLMAYDELLKTKKGN